MSGPKSTIQMSPRHSSDGFATSRPRTARTADGCPPEGSRPIQVLLGDRVLAISPLILFVDGCLLSYADSLIQHACQQGTAPLAGSREELVGACEKVLGQAD
jgi:hypothetical protein